MTENARLFFQQLSANHDLANKVSQMNVDEIIATAVQMGIPMTAADLKPDEEINDSDLAAIAGGEKQNCYCVGSGGGKADPEDNERPCACITFGHGWRGDDVPYCECVFLGGGQDKDLI